MQKKKKRAAKSSFVPYIKTPIMGELDQKKLPAIVQIEPGTVLHMINGRKCILGNRLGAGGEVIVFATSKPELVAKIYKSERLTATVRDKLQLMCKKGLNYSEKHIGGICWPKSPLTDKDDVFRGYLMPKAVGKNLSKCIFVRRELENPFPHWDRRHLVKLCITLLLKIRLLHESNIIIGDINPNNVMVHDEKTVYFVDMDSYQLEGYPCSAGTVHFTAPELQKTSFAKFMRRTKHENFAVATLLFMILHAGKQPYAQIGGSSPIQNISGMEFPYPLGKKTNRKAPEGAMEIHLE